MIVVDANLLLYAKIERLPQHVPAQRWLDRQLSGHQPVGLPWASLLAFARIGSNPRLFERPLTLAGACAQIATWLSSPVAWVPLPTTDHLAHFTNLIAVGPSSPKLVTDAHLAALALEHRATLCSADLGFGRFPRLRWENPLA